MSEGENVGGEIGAPAAPAVNIIAALTSPAMQAKVATLKKKTLASKEALSEAGDPFPEEFAYDSLYGTIMTAINGLNNLSEQKVAVEYLPTDVLLTVPTALAIHPSNHEYSKAEHNDELVSRYWKVATMTFSDIVQLLNSSGTQSAKRAKIDALALPTAEVSPLPWELPGYYTLAGQGEMEPQVYHSVFAVLSKMLRLNCDIRDLGFLVKGSPTSRVQDNAWATAMTLSKDRFKPQLMPYTLDSMAALNLASCGGWVIGAWVRAYGVGCGCLPAENTKLNKEWKYTRGPAKDGDMNRVQEVHNTLGAPLVSLCMNIIAMFGIMHLSKDHTFITGDAAMERVGMSHINALRTMVPVAVVDDIKAHQEIAVRTAPHPFGIGQAYWVAKAMYALGMLTTPLAIRLSATPPHTQRLMIVEAASVEWQGMPIGVMLNSLFEGQLAPIRSEIALIRADPPAYSDLWEIYGCPSKKKVPDEVKQAADSMMPLVCGFATALHVDDQQRKDGLALAMSFLNVERDAKAATRTYTNLWNNYVDHVDSKGLEEFVRSTYKLGNIGKEGQGKEPG